MKLSHILLLSAFLLSFQVHAMEPDDLIEHIYDHSITYSPGYFAHYKEEVTLSTQAQRPQNPKNQKILIYEGNSQQMQREAILKKVIPGKDGRVRIANTTAWPYSIHAQLDMLFDGVFWGESGAMVGPHHLLTCAHNVYDYKKQKWAEKIFVHPALDERSAPFGKINVVKVYTFKRWLRGDQQFDMALLLLDEPIGKYTGWGGLVSTSDSDLIQEKVHITGYPGDGDKGCKQMWSMSHTIKTVKSEQFDYEIDTFGGQSGSAVWINKWGTPMILGVHTTGSDLINSGVRLSGQKFMDLLLKVMPTTYVLKETEILNNFSPALKIQPLELEKAQNDYFRERKEAFATRESQLDECINQYKKIINANITYTELLKILDFVINAYTIRIEYAEKLHSEIHNFLVFGSLNITDALHRANSLKAGGNVQPKEPHIIVRQPQHGVSRGRYISIASIQSIGKIIKDDIFETMEIYKEIYGHPHSRWEEIIPETYVLKETEVLNNFFSALKIQPSELPQVLNDYLREKKEAFAIRESLIDECINQYKALKSQNITYLQLYNICKKLHPLYFKRQIISQAKKINDMGCERVLQVWFMKEGTDGMERILMCHEAAAHHPQQPAHTYASELIESIKRDVLRGMELYKELYGKPHLRWDEFSKM